MREPVSAKLEPGRGGAARGSRPSLALFLLLIPVLLSPVSAKPASWKGLALSVALEALRAQGLAVIYSSDLVGPDMRVRAEPVAVTPREILDEILAVEGLAAREGPGGRLLVVRAAAPLRIVRGQVLDAASGRPLPLARVSAAGAGAEVSTDESGRFVTPPLPPACVALQVSRLGYSPVHVALEQDGDPSGAETRVELHPLYQLSEAVRVTARELPGPGGPIEQRQTLDPGFLGRGPLSGDPLRALDSVPGVVGEEQTSRLHVRGGVDDEVLVVFDGLELYKPFHAPERRGMFSVIDGGAVGSVSVLGGGFPARYGGRMSGVVDIESMDPDGATDTAIHAGSEGYRLAGHGQLLQEKGHWLASLRAGDPAAMLDSLGVDPGYVPRYYDFLSKVSFRLSDRTTLALHGLAVMDELEGPGDKLVTAQGDELQAESGQRYVWVGVDHLITPRLHSRTLLSWGWLDSSRSGTTAAIDLLDDRRKTELRGLEQDWNFSTGRHVLGWGFDLDYLETDYRYRLDPVEGASLPARDLTLDPSGFDVALYVSDRIRIRPRLDVELGMRWSRQDYAPGGTRAAGRINAAYRLGRQTTLHAAWGDYDQPQRIDELQVEDGVDTFYGSQRAEHRVIGLSQGLPAGLRLDVTAYDKNMSRLAPRYENLFDPYSFFPEAAPDRVVVTPSVARSRGLEIALRNSPAQRVDWWASYAYSSAQDRIDGRNVARAWDEPHSLAWGVAFEPVKAWELSMRGMHHTGRPTTPVTGLVQTLPDGSFEIVPQLGSRNSDRLPAFHRLDLDLARNFRIQGSELRLWGGVANLLNSSNVCCVERFDFVREPEGDVTTLRREHGGLSRLLTWGLTWRF